MSFVRRSFFCEIGVCFHKEVAMWKFYREYRQTTDDQNVHFKIWFLIDKNYKECIVNKNPEVQQYTSNPEH